MPNQEMDAWLVKVLGVAKTLLDAAISGAAVQAPAPQDAPAGTPQAPSGSLPQPMAPDCQIVIGKVPGPANFVLCKTHGHVLDTDKKLIVAGNVDQFLTQHPEFRKAPPAAATPASPPSAAPTDNTTPDRPAPSAPSADVTAIVAQINAALAQLDAESKRLQDDGIPAEPLDRQIAGLRSRLAAAIKSGATAKQMTALQTAAAAALDKLKKDADRQADAATAGTDKAVQDLRDAAAKQIDKLDAGNAEKAQLVAKLKDLDAQIKGLQTTTDASKQAVARQAVDSAAQDLLQAAVTAGGKGPLGNN